MLNNSSNFIKVFIKRICVLFFAIGALNISAIDSTPKSAVSPEEITVVEEFAHKLISDCFKTLEDKTKNKSQQIKFIQDLLRKNLDFSKMTDFTLGRHKRDFSSDQFKKFQESFKDYLVSFYANTIKEYKGKKPDSVFAVSKNTDEFLVKTVIITDNGNIKVDYMIRKVGPKEYKIFDVLTENYSLLNSNRTLFNDFIQTGGFDRLMNEVKNLRTGLSAGDNK